MTTYLVDYENVKGDGLNGINNLTDKDKVHIFYSENADLHSAYIKDLMKLPAKSTISVLK